MSDTQSLVLEKLTRDMDKLRRFLATCGMDKAQMIAVLKAALFALETEEETWNSSPDVMVTIEYRELERLRALESSIALLTAERDMMREVVEALRSVLSEDGVKEYLSAYVMGVELIERVSKLDDAKRVHTAFGYEAKAEAYPMDKRDDAKLCPCGGKLIAMPESEPYNAAHWQCAKCDSTFSERDDAKRGTNE